MKSDRLYCRYREKTKQYEDSHTIGELMNRVKEEGSIFRKPLRTSYDYMKLLNKEFKEYKVLVIDDKDGLYSIPFFKSCHK